MAGENEECGGGGKGEGGVEWKREALAACCGS